MSQEEPGGAKGEPGARRNQGEPGEPGGAMGSQEESGGPSAWPDWAMYCSFSERDVALEKAIWLFAAQCTFSRAAPLKGSS